MNIITRSVRFCRFSGLSISADLRDLAGEVQVEVRTHVGAALAAVRAAKSILDIEKPDAVTHLPVFGSLSRLWIGLIVLLLGHPQSYFLEGRSIIVQSAIAYCSFGGSQADP